MKTKSRKEKLKNRSWRKQRGVLRTPAFYKLEEAREMSFTKADLEKEKDELNRLISEDEDARKAHQEFQARIALQQKLIQMRKAERMTQEDVAKASGLSQQAVSRIERGTGATISSLIKYLAGIGYSIELKKT